MKFVLYLAWLWSGCVSACVTVTSLDQFGAIALGGNGFGAAQAKDDEKSAAASAIAQCEESGGGGSCKVRVAYKNQCAALAVGADRMVGVAYARDISVAQKLAKKSCDNSSRYCRLIYAACSYPY